MKASKAGVGLGDAVGRGSVGQGDTQGVEKPPGLEPRSLPLASLGVGADEGWVWFRCDLDPGQKKPRG